MDRIEAAKELPFRVGFTGHSGHLTIEPLPPVERPKPLDSLPFVLVSISTHSNSALFCRELGAFSVATISFLQLFVRRVSIFLNAYDGFFGI